MPEDYSALSDLELNRLVAERFERKPEPLTGDAEDLADIAEMDGRPVLSPLGFWRWQSGSAPWHSDWAPINLADDIGAAWCVVGQLKWPWELQHYRNSYEFTIEDDGAEDGYPLGSAKSAPRAICIAALQAVNHD